MRVATRRALLFSSKNTKRFPDYFRTPVRSISHAHTHRHTRTSGTNIIFFFRATFSVPGASYETLRSKLNATILFYIPHIRPKKATQID